MFQNQTFLMSFSFSFSDNVPAMYARINAKRCVKRGCPWIQERRLEIAYLARKKFIERYQPSKLRLIIRFS